jgi:hypothetical protein
MLTSNLLCIKEEASSSETSVYKVTCHKRLACTLGTCSKERFVIGNLWKYSQLKWMFKTLFCLKRQIFVNHTSIYNNYTNNIWAVNWPKCVNCVRIVRRRIWYRHFGDLNLTELHSLWLRYLLCHICEYRHFS